MANVKVIWTDGLEEELIKEFPSAIRLHLAAKENVENKEKYFGDYLTNEKAKNTFALITREGMNSKSIPEAIRLSVLNLFVDIVQKGEATDVILMNKYQFNSHKEEISFICILKEIMLTCFNESIENDITLIIHDCRKEYIEVGFLGEVR